MTEKENIMGTQKMSRLILSTGIPLMLSLFINSLYNFVDSMFISRVSEDALTALSLAAPVQMLVSALGLGNAVGLNAVISRALGGCGYFYSVMLLGNYSDSVPSFCKTLF